MRFTPTITCAAILVFSAPLVALAQMQPDQGVVTQMQQARDAAKTAALNDLTPDHRTKVEAIAQQVQSGSLSSQDAAKQIDGMLTDTETQAVLGEQQKLRDAMRQAFGASGGTGGGFGSGGGRFGGHGGFGGRQGNRTPDAGQFLLTLVNGN